MKQYDFQYVKCVMRHFPAFGFRLRFFSFLESSWLKLRIILFAICIVPIETSAVDGCNRFSFQLLCTFQVDMLGIVLIKSKLLLVIYL